MSQRDEQDFDRNPDAADAADAAEPAGRAIARRSPGANARAVAGSEDDEAAPALPLVLSPALWEEAYDERIAASSARAFRRWAAGVGVLAAALVAACAAAFVVVDHHRQASLLAERTQENTRLAQTVASLGARLQAIESAKGRDELAELRRSVNDLKSAADTSHELGAAIAQLSQRVEKLDREQDARIEKLGERVDRGTTTHAAELSARIEKLEKKPQAPAPVLAGPQPTTPQPPKFGNNVSLDPTGSIDRPKPILRGYVVLGVRDDIAMIGGQYGERAVRPGDFLPGAGRIERVERQGPNWVVVTEHGLIASAYAAPD